MMRRRKGNPPVKVRRPFDVQALLAGLLMAWLLATIVLLVLILNGASA